MSRFLPGQSGNPNGRPKIPDEIKNAFKAATPDAAAFLIELMSNPQADMKLRKDAAIHILDRSLGRPVSVTELSGPDGGAIEISDTPEESRKRLVALLLAQVAKQTQEETE